MKICMISSSSFERNYSSYHLMRDLILHLLNEENRIVLIQKYYDQKGTLPKEIANDENLTVREIKVANVAKSSMIQRMIADALYYLRTTREIIRAKDSDVFFLQSNNLPYLPIFLIHMITHRPVVYNIQDIFPQNAASAGLLQKNSFKYILLSKLQKWALKHSDAIVTISEDMKRTLIDAGGEEKRIAVSYNWENKVSEAGVEFEPDQDFHVVYAGNIGVMQNVEIIVEAAKILEKEKRIKFDIYGSGIRKEKCKQLAAGSNNICFHDPVPANQAFSLYLNADLNVITLGKGIISTALPSKTAACIQSGKPFLFSVDQDSLFAETLRDCGIPVSDPTTAEELAEEIYRESIRTEAFSTPERLKDLFSQETSLKKYSEVLYSFRTKEDGEI